MNNCKTFLAVDLGASSGRVMAGHFDGTRLAIEQVWRFPNQGQQHADGWHWDAHSLFENIRQGLAAAGSKFGRQVVSVAVDTWGVDYGLLDAGGELLNPPWMYRDGRTDGLMAAAGKQIGDLWQRTGIQPMFFNTIYQLMAERSSGAFAKAADLLFMPDLLNYWLSDVKTVERTIASTSGLLRAGRAEWDMELAGLLAIPERLLKPLTEPAVLLGALREKLAEETGLRNVQVTTCGSHDTASAVAGVPAESPNPLFISSGTWSLLGRELSAPVLSEEARLAGFSNEQGLCGTTRFLTNIAGMWLLQECRRVWLEAGDTIDFVQMEQAAAGCTASALIDPDAAEFSKSCDMPRVIGEWIERSGQTKPSDKAGLVRVILESLALKYRRKIASLRALQPDLPDTIHVVGGGSRNLLLDQMMADATGMRVIAGPDEATAAGNILAQMLATGCISSLAEGRQVSRVSFEPRMFEPGDRRPWDEKEALFAKTEAVMRERQS